MAISGFARLTGWLLDGVRSCAIGTFSITYEHGDGGRALRPIPGRDRQVGELDAALAAGRAPKPIDWFPIDDAWAHGHQRYATRTTGDIGRIARTVASTLARDPHQTPLTASTDWTAVAVVQTVAPTESCTDRNGFAAAQNASCPRPSRLGVGADELGENAAVVSTMAHTSS